MNFLGKITSAALFALCLPTASMAYFTQGDAGQEVFSFLSTFDSPRNAALEKSASAAPSTDPSIVQLNPAGLRLPEKKKRVVSAHWQTGEFAENQGTLSYTSSYRFFVYQFSYNWLDYGSIDGYDEFGNETGIEYKPLSQLSTFSIAFPLKHIQFGATIKVASDKLAAEDGDRPAIGAAFDWGISWQSNSKVVGLSLVARDFGIVLRDYVDDGENTHYPMAQEIALAGFFKPKSLRRLTLFAESDFPRFAEADLNLGAEYFLGESFAARIGFTRTWLDLSRDFKQLTASNSRPGESNKARMLSAGLGYTSSLISLDYAFSYLAQSMGVEHRIGLRVGF